MKREFFVATYRILFALCSASFAPSAYATDLGHLLHRFAGTPETSFLQAQQHKGEEHFRLKRFPEAQQSAERILLVSPGNLDALNLRGLARSAQKDITGAEADFAACLAINPQYRNARFNRASLFLENRQYAEAIQDLDLLLATDSEDYEAVHRRGRAYYEQANYAKATTDFSTCVRLLPSEPAAYHNLALSQLHSQEYKEAIFTLNIYIGLRPGDALAYYNRGFAYSQLKQYEAALRDFNRSIERQPTHTNSYYRRALCYLFLGDRAAHKDENNPDAIEDYAKAVTDFARTVERSDSFSEAYFNLAQACIKWARSSEEEAPYGMALKALQRFLELSPADKDVPVVKNQIAQIQKRLARQR